MKIFYNSSMPRSGSTLFQNIIGQNPDFYVTPTSGVLELLYGARGNYSSSLEFKAQDAQLMRDAFLGFCKGGMEAYYGKLTNKPCILDKSRGWGIHHSLLNMIFDKPKIVCVVRDLRDVFASMEKKFRENADISDGTLDWNTMRGTTTPKRIDIWANNPPISIALERVNQIINEKLTNKILFIKYEDMLNHPNNVFENYYKFIDEPYFQHDFNNIEQLTVEDDSIYGIYGDHKVKKTLQPLNHSYQTVLTQQVNDWIYENYKWYFEFFKYKK